MQVNSETEMFEKVMLSGRPYWLYGDGTMLPVISGGDGDDSDGDEGGGNDSDEGGQNFRGPITENDMKRIAKRERTVGRQKGRSELAKDLGFESEEAMRNAIGEYQRAADEKKSEDEKAREKLLRDQQVVAEERSKAKRERYDARCERALIRAGCSDKVVERAIRLMELDPNDDLEFEDFVEAAKKLKEDVPGLFTSESSAGSDNSGNPDSDPGSSSRRGGGEKTAEEQAREIFDRRHPKQPVSTGT